MLYQVKVIETVTNQELIQEVNDFLLINEQKIEELKELRLTSEWKKDTAGNEFLAKQAIIIYEASLENTIKD